MYNNFRSNGRAPGMQIHAVPEAERALDRDGRKLPWAYDYSITAGNAENGDRPPVEKGPFGTAPRRTRSGISRSRSKTAEPRREEERAKRENEAAEEAVFGSLRRVGTKEDGKRDTLSDVDANAVATQPGALARIPASKESDSEPTEVLLFGFGDDLQWAAIDFYERVSNGIILEDYERQAPGSRYDISRSLGRQAAQKSLSRAAMRKKNIYAGGEHWIKITFDSRQAAELAMARSPHTIKGYLVYAQLYQNHGPQADAPIFATQAGAQITSEALPTTFATTKPLNGSPNGSSTVSSATATAPSTRRPAQLNQDSPTGSSTTMNSGPDRRVAESIPPVQTTAFQPPQQVRAADTTALLQRRSRIEGTIRATVLPAEEALIRKQSRSSWTAWLGAGEVIGSAVPRTEDGAFDWNKASFYWRMFWLIDQLFGTDLCGLRADD